MERSLRFKKPVAALSAGCAALLLASCSLSDVLPPEMLEEPVETPRPEDGPLPELHPGLRDCAPEGSDDELSLADADLNATSWSTPQGYEEVTSMYYEDNPVEDLQWMWVVAPPDPSAATLDIVSVNYYTGVAWNAYADNCQSVPLTAVEERLENYRTHINAEPLSEAEMITIDGHAAITQDIRLANYDYEGYWIFSTDELLHVYCQWESPHMEKEIRKACKDVVRSLKIVN